MLKLPGAFSEKNQISCFFRTQFVTNSEKYGRNGYDYKTIEHVKCGSNELSKYIIF